MSTQDLRSVRIFEANHGEITLVLAVSNAAQPGDLAVITSDHTTAIQLQLVANLLLDPAGRQHLATWLGLDGPALLTRPMDWPDPDQTQPRGDEDA